MSKVVNLPKPDALYDEASAWIAKLDRSLSPAEEQQLKQWLACSPRHPELLFEMASLWDRMDSLARLAELFPAPKKRYPQRSHWYYALAASLLLAISGVWMTYHAAPGILPAWPAKHSPELVDGVYETAVGEHSTVNLPDGSQLILNTDSLVRVHYTAQARVFHLERGELHVDVAHDNTRPLSVVAADKIVQAVGTAFNVQLSREHELELIVTDGRVLVADRKRAAEVDIVEPLPLPQNSLAVSRGEKIILGLDEAEVEKIATSDIEASLSWRHGNLVFRGETLEEALAEISRYTDVKFEIVEEDIKAVRIAGLFKAGDINGLLVTLEKNFNINHNRVSSERIELKSIQ